MLSNFYFVLDQILTTKSTNKVIQKVFYYKKMSQAKQRITLKEAGRGRRCVLNGVTYFNSLSLVRNSLWKYHTLLQTLLQKISNNTSAEVDCTLV